MLRESLLIRTPSSDMWHACVFIFRAKLHPALQPQSLELRHLLLAFPKPHCSSCESAFTCWCRCCLIHVQRHRTSLLKNFLHSSSQTQHLWGSGRWWRGGAAINSCQTKRWWSASTPVRPGWVITPLCQGSAVAFVRRLLGCGRSVKQHCALCLRSAPFPV